MKSVNSVHILGNVGKEPEIRAITSGIHIANFSVATADRVKEGGEWKDSTTWHNIVAFGKTAEVVRDYLHKGNQVFIEGRIQNRSWEQDGEKKYRSEIVASNIVLIGSSRGLTTEKVLTPAVDDIFGDDDSAPF